MKWITISLLAVGMLEITMGQMEGPQQHPKSALQSGETEGPLYGPELPPLPESVYPIPANFHERMMQSTFLIQGANSCGTGFVIDEPAKDDPDRYWQVLVTADHVLRGIEGDFVVLNLPVFEENRWLCRKHSLAIRKEGRALWSKHPAVDLAVMRVDLPLSFARATVPLQCLMDDEDIKSLAIGTGTELQCLGYPMGHPANQYGFALLRSGKVASYPILPTREMGTFSFDFSVFPGNSGGPVYFNLNTIVTSDGVSIGTAFGIMGLVTAERVQLESLTQTRSETREIRTPLILGEVIHASFIREAISALPGNK